MELADLIATMQARVAQCRRLVNATSDARTATILRGMADEGEDEIRRLMERGTEFSPPPPDPES